MGDTLDVAVSLSAFGSMGLGFASTVANSCVAYAAAEKGFDLSLYMAIAAPASVALLTAGCSGYSAVERALDDGFRGIKCKHFRIRDVLANGLIVGSASLGCTAFYYWMGSI